MFQLCTMRFSAKILVQWTVYDSFVRVKESATPKPRASSGRRDCAAIFSPSPFDPDSFSNKWKPQCTFVFIFFLNKYRSRLVTDFLPRPLYKQVSFFNSLNPTP